MSNGLHVRSTVELSSTHRLRAAFTLLELSIVLVIMGLLIGGVFAGQSLVHNAQINAFLSESNRYQTAFQAFREQYQALPGDMTNATTVWGTAGGTGSDIACQNTVSVTSATCNGNGNGLISTSVVSQDEMVRAWQHLANAKIIEGSYIGVYLPGGWQAGINIPTSKYGSTTSWGVLESDAWPTAGDVNWFAADYGGGNNLTTHFTGSTISGKDAWSVDKKIDDARPAQGNVVAGFWSTCTTAGAKTDVSAAYRLSDGHCNLTFLTSF